MELDGFCLRTVTFYHQDRARREKMFLKSITGGDRFPGAAGLLRTRLLGAPRFRRRNAAVPPRGLRRACPPVPPCPPGLSLFPRVPPGCPYSPLSPRLSLSPHVPPSPRRAVARPCGAPWRAAAAPALTRPRSAAAAPAPAWLVASSKSLRKYRLSALS